MADKRPLPRHILAQNLKALKAKSGLSAPEIARRSKPPVDRKTVTNYLRGETDPRPDKVEAIAKGFGLTSAALMSASFNPEMADDQNLPKLLELYRFANEDGRNLILRVAEAAPKAS
jgi:transcriptional regulator with XRE-family HTH domain